MHFKTSVRIAATFFLSVTIGIRLHVFKSLFFPDIHVNKTYQINLHVNGINKWDHYGTILEIRSA